MQLTNNAFSALQREKPLDKAICSGERVVALWYESHPPNDAFKTKRHQEDTGYAHLQVIASLAQNLVIPRMPGPESAIHAIVIAFSFTARELWEFIFLMLSSSLRVNSTFRIEGKQRHLLCMLCSSAAAAGTVSVHGTLSVIAWDRYLRSGAYSVIFDEGNQPDRGKQGGRKG